MKNESLFDFLNQRHNPALEIIDASSGSNYKYGELIKELPDFTRAEKKVVFLYLDNSYESVKLFLAFLKSNHALFLLNTSLNLSFKKTLEAYYKPSFIFDNDRKESIAGMDLVYEGGKMKGYEIVKISDTEIKIHVHPDIKILLSTSGTTGSQKFVKLTDYNFIANCNSILDYLPIQAGDVCPLNLPIHYSYGLSVLITNIARGGKIVCTNETVLSRNFWDLFEKYSCTSLAGVPYTYEMLNRLGFTKKSYKSLRYLTQAGGKLSEPLLKIFSAYAESQNIPFYVMYGQTEATARMSYLPPDKLIEKWGSIGKPVKDGHFRLGESGELIYTGPNAGCGYCYQPEDLKECAYTEELHTGDLARSDADGFYYITGRMKRFIKLFGNRISLDDLENDLKTHYAHFVGCTGIEDKKLLVFSDVQSLKPEAVKNYISSKYQIHISAIEYHYVDVIPLTPSQKVDYIAVLEITSKGTPAGGSI